MRTELGNTLAARLPLTLFDVKQIGSALSEVVVIKEEVPVDVQVKTILPPCTSKIRCY